MDQYVITYRGEAPSRGDSTKLVAYEIETEARRFLVTACASGSAAASGRLGGVDVVPLLRRAALVEIEARLSGGFFPEDWSPTGVATTLTYDTDEVPALEALLSAQKDCLWLEEAEPRGHVCAATRPQDSPTTTPRLCNMCEVPDRALVCEAFIFPRVHSDNGQAGRTRHVVEAQCDIDQPVHRGADCTPGGKECWRRSISAGQSAPPADPDAPRRVVDEIGYLRLVYADAFELSHGATQAFWPASGESAVNSLRNPCSSPSDFRERIVSLGEILLKIRPHDQLSEERRAENGRKVNGLTALQRVLEDRFVGAALDAASLLKELVEARNRFSHDDRKELLAALRALGVMWYPPQSYEIAWWQVAASIANALSHIRSAIQSADPLELPTS